MVEVYTKTAMVHIGYNNPPVFGNVLPEEKFISMSQDVEK